MRRNGRPERQEYADNVEGTSYSGVRTSLVLVSAPQERALDSRWAPRAPPVRSAPADRPPIVSTRARSPDGPADHSPRPSQSKRPHPPSVRLASALSDAVTHSSSKRRRPGPRPHCRQRDQGPRTSLTRSGRPAAVGRLFHPLDVLIAAVLYTVTGLGVAILLRALGFARTGRPHSPSRLHRPAGRSSLSVSLRHPCTWPVARTGGCPCRLAVPQRPHARGELRSRSAGRP